MSQMRKRYMFRLVFRCIVLTVSVMGVFLTPEEFSVLEGMNFFREFSVLHLLWLIWVWDMILQIIPVKNKLPLGSMKLFANRFQPVRDKFSYETNGYNRSEVNRFVEEVITQTEGIISKCKWQKKEIEK